MYVSFSFMIALEFKVKGKPEQFDAIDEAIRAAQFIRNKALRFWMDNHGVGKNDLQKLCAKLAKEFGESGRTQLTSSPG